MNYEIVKKKERTGFGVKWAASTGVDRKRLNCARFQFGSDCTYPVWSFPVFAIFHAVR